MRSIIFHIMLLAAFLLPLESGAGDLEPIRYSFEDSTDGWRVPDWALYQGDHVAESLEISTDHASEGESSAVIMCDFTGKSWQAALVEVQKPFDLTGYDEISVDVYMPRRAPRNLMQGRIILTAGEGWYFTEMKAPVYLPRGKWTTIRAELESTRPESSVWKGREEKRLYKNIDKIKKISVRIEYDVAPPTRLGRKYKGPIYLDNVVIE
ncbi:MAG: hypothetical protein GF392_03085 [Candidatus Omnitrophica bacterium]|nr:hypothetical protein [Candidatus Omnitrophota bacterium]